MAEANLAELAYAQHQAEEELEKQARIVLARDLYAGDLNSDLVDELENFLLSGDASKIQDLFNIYAVVIDEVKDRLSVTDFMNTPKPRPGYPDDGQHIEWAARFWQENRLDEYQHEVYENGLVDGEGFIVLSPEEDPHTGAVHIRAIPHQRYTDAEVGGDNEGIKLHYADNERVGIRPISASKRWIEVYYNEDNRRQTRPRMTIYALKDEENPSRVEKYEFDAGEWRQYKPEGSDEEWPIIWPDEIPLPVIHFRNVGSRSQGRRAQGAQQILDNLIVALTAGASSMGSPAYLIIGAYPTTDGEPPDENSTNVLKLGPGRYLYFGEAKPEDVHVEVLKPGDLKQLIETVDRTMRLAAVTTSTPSLLSHRIGGNPVAAEALQRLDIRPTATARRVQDAFGNAWSEMFKVAARMMREYGAEDPPGEDEDVVHVRWMPADVVGKLPADGKEPETPPEAAPAANGASPQTTEQKDAVEADIVE